MKRGLTSKKDKMNVSSLIGDTGICIRYLSPKFYLAFIFKILKLFIEKASIWNLLKLNAVFFDISELIF
jgi:hypothetical protein